MTSVSPPSTDPIITAFLYAGEARVNLIRLAGLVIFYGNHLVLTWSQPLEEKAAIHEGARYTAVVLLWVAVVGLVHMALKRDWDLKRTAFAASLSDVGLVTILAAMTGGPQSSFLLLYLVVIGSTPLRASLGLVYATTAVALGGYAAIQMGADMYDTSSALPVSRAEQAIYFLTLVVAGLLAGQVVRQLRRFLNSPAHSMG